MAVPMICILRTFSIRVCLCARVHRTSDERAQDSPLSRSPTAGCSAQTKEQASNLPDDARLQKLVVNRAQGRWEKLCRFQEAHSTHLAFSYQEGRCEAS